MSIRNPKSKIRNPQMWRRFFVVVVLLLVAGCSRNTFVGQRLGNFTAYYNTFYNAEKAYDEGVKAITTSADQQAIDRDVYLPLFGGEGRVVAQTQAFQSAIEKSSDILRDHPNSKWVDDALLLIGKSYFYLQNHVGAETKFREVETLDSPLEDEARFWLARTYIVSAQYDRAANHLEESLIREDLSRRWEPKLRLALGSLYVKRQAWEDAVTELETGLENVRDNDLAARAQFLLGQVYETLGRYEEAVAAFEAVSRYNPLYELSYAAQIEAVRVEGMHGDTEAALRKLRRMERDDKNYENRAELAYLRGRLYQFSGRPEEALDAYYVLLYDSDANITDVRGRTHYALGEFYRDVYADYPLAAAHFDTASTALGGNRQQRAARGGAAQEARAPAAITDAVEQARTFGSFAEVIGTVSHMDSLLYLGSLDDASFQEVVLELRRQRAEELERQREAIERRQAEQQFAGNTFNQEGQRNNQPATSTGGATSSDGFLYHKNPIQVQENLANFELRWGERPLVPNWRRIEAVQGIGSADTADQPGVPAGVDPALAEQAALPDVDISNVPRDSLSQATMRAQRAMARYELGNVLFLSMGRPDSAAVWYRMVIEEDSDEPVAQRAYYALAEVQRALGDTLASNRLYEAILDQYPTSEFSTRARERLGRAVEAPTDSLAQAEAAYDAAYTAWQRDNYHTSLNDLVEVAVRFRETPVAPRALLAAGSVYMEWATRDSLSLFDPLPLTVSDSLLLEGGLLKVKPKPLPTPIDSAAAPPTPAPSDTLAMPGNLGAAPDTLAMPDNLPVPSDSTMKEEGDIAAVQNLPADTSAVAPQRSLASVDTTRIPPDSLAALEVLVDTTAIEYEPVRLETLYNTLTTAYPQAPQTAQARRVLNALMERQAAIQAVADSIAAAEQALADSMAAAQLPAADTTAVPDAVVPDSGAVSPPTAEVAMEAGKEKGDAMGAIGSMLRDKESRTPPDSLPADSAVDRKARLRDMLNRRQREAGAQPEDSVQAAQQDTTSTGAVQTDSTVVVRPPEPAPPDTTAAQPVPSPAAQPEARRAPGLTDEERAQGGWTIIVASEGSQREAELRLPLFRTRLHEAGYPVDIFAAPSDDPPRYRIGVGLFASQKEAASALARLAAQLPEDAWVLKVTMTE